MNQAYLENKLLYKGIAFNTKNTLFQKNELRNKSQGNLSQFSSKTFRFNDTAADVTI